MRWSFRTVSEELIGCACETAYHYESLGYKVTIEPTELGYPSTPTLQARRGNTRIVVEVVDKVDEALCRQWVAYGKSSGQDLRVVFSLKEDAALDSKVEALMRTLGVGCVQRSGVTIVDRMLPADLALNVELPNLSQMPTQVRRSLGPAYEHFRIGNWREGFSDACQAFEMEARKYLKRHSRKGRIEVLRKKKNVKLSSSEIDQMTMGQLAATFSRIIKKNQSDQIVGATLAAVNKDRIGVAHKKTSKRVESSLRKNVGRHMWVLFAGFKEVIR